MQVELEQISKNFQNHAVFKRVNLSIPAGYRGVILGGNGSGKSTLLKVISGALAPSTGKIYLLDDGQKIPESQHYKHIAFCGPYTELIEDLTLGELIDFQSKFRPFIPGLTKQQLIDLLYLKKFQNKPLKVYSSGMKQRVRLVLAILADVPIVLLDEPTSNLDPDGKKWYRKLIEDYIQDRTVIVASNFLEEEYFFARDQITLAAFQ